MFFIFALDVCVSESLFFITVIFIGATGLGASGLFYHRATGLGASDALPHPYEPHPTEVSIMKSSSSMPSTPATETIFEREIEMPAAPLSELEFVTIQFLSPSPTQAAAGVTDILGVGICDRLRDPEAVGDAADADAVAEPAADFFSFIS